MKDSFSREIKYMRISVTDRCNLRCKYCMPEEGVDNLGHGGILSYEEISRIVKASTSLGITKYRLTGGEPLARLGIVSLVENLAAIKGVEELAMTTNGTLLADKAKALKAAGLQRVNISVDSLIYDKYKAITRGGDLYAVFEGIRAALEAGLTPLKLNVVAMKGFNDDEIQNFVKLSIDHPIDIRFIELMPVGKPGKKKDFQYMSSEEIRNKLPGLISLDRQEGVSELYRYTESRGNIGFISPMSHMFCSSCDKIRLTADGKLKPCLHTNEEIDLNQVLRTGNDQLLEDTIREAILRKGERHHLNDGAEPVDRGMSQIGG